MTSMATPIPKSCSTLAPPAPPVGCKHLEETEKDFLSSEFLKDETVLQSSPPPSLPPSPKSKRNRGLG